jgi:transposase InsO family protein
VVSDCIDFIEDWLHGRDAAAVDQGCQRREEPSAAAVTDEKARMRALERENRELRQANEILRKASARCTVERLMRFLALQGVRRGRSVTTTMRDRTQPCPLDRVNRQFTASMPNALWVADFTYVSTWQGFAYVAFVIDVFARCIVGWRVSATAHTDFVLDALEQAIHDRRPVSQSGLIHHSDRGSQYLSMRYTERLKDAGIKPSVGNVGDSYDNPVLSKVEGPWPRRSMASTRPK